MKNNIKKSIYLRINNIRKKKVKHLSTFHPKQLAERKINLAPGNISRTKLSAWKL